MGIMSKIEFWLTLLFLFVFFLQDFKIPRSYTLGLEELITLFHAEKDILS